MPRKTGRAKPLRPAAGVSVASRGPSVAVSDACDSNGVATAPSRPIAVFLPSSRLPMVCPSAPLTWPSGCGLPAVSGENIAWSKSTVLRSRSVGDKPDDGSVIGRWPLSFSISITSRSSSAMRSVGPDGTGPGTVVRDLALDRRDRRRIGETGRGETIRLLELQHRRHRQRSVQAVLSQRRVGAERVERLLDPQGVVRRHGHARARRGGCRCRSGPPDINRCTCRSMSSASGRSSASRR